MVVECRTFVEAEIKIVHLLRKTYMARADVWKGMHMNYSVIVAMKLALAT